MGYLEANNLTKIYERKTIIKDVSLTLKKGDIYSFIGPSGAGKSTFLRIINLLEKPTSGEIIFDGKNFNGISKEEIIEIRRRMAFVFQKPVLFNMSVFDNVAWGLNIRKIKWDEVKKRTTEAIKTVGLTEFEDQNALYLSGGEAQRVSIARCIVIEPELLLLDEPTANLDPSNVSLVESIIKRMNKEKDMTILMATHNMLQAKRLGTKIGFLLEGELVEEGSATQIFDNPTNKKTFDFVQGNMIY
jgi:tungstate transport system ATP-binding protein